MACVEEKEVEQGYLERLCAIELLFVRVLLP